MDLYTDRDELVRGLERAVLATSKLDAYRHVQLTASRDRGIALFSRGAALSCSTSTVCNVEAEGAAIVDARQFLDVVRALPDATVRLASSPSKRPQLQVWSGPARFDVSTYSEITEPIGLARSAAPVEFAARDLRRLLDSTVFAASTDDVRYGLNGLHLEVVDGELVRAVATNGHRLAMAETSPTAGSLAMPRKKLLGRPVLDAMRSILARAERHERAALLFGEAHGAFTYNETRLEFDLVDGEFPDYRAVLPASWKMRINAPRKALVDVLRRAAIMGKTPGRTTTLLPTEGGFNVRAMSDLGRFEEFVPAEIEGSPFVVGLRRDYFVESLEAMSGERWVLELAGALSPARIYDPERELRELQILMPVRLDSEEHLTSAWL